jgi:hypothetical protein
MVSQTVVNIALLVSQPRFISIQAYKKSKHVYKRIKTLKTNELKHSTAGNITWLIPAVSQCFQVQVFYYINK